MDEHEGLPDMIRLATNPTKTPTHQAAEAFRAAPQQPRREAWRA